MEGVGNVSLTNFDKDWGFLHPNPSTHGGVTRTLSLPVLSFADPGNPCGSGKPSTGDPPLRSRPYGDP